MQVKDVRPDYISVTTWKDFNVIGAIKLYIEIACGNDYYLINLKDSELIPANEGEIVSDKATLPLNQKAHQSLISSIKHLLPDNTAELDKTKEILKLTTEHKDDLRKAIDIIQFKEDGR